jgi:hypothetical protein
MICTVIFRERVALLFEENEFFVRVATKGAKDGCTGFSTNKQCLRNLTMKFVNSFICRYFQYF